MTQVCVRRSFSVYDGVVAKGHRYNVYLERSVVDEYRRLQRLSPTPLPSLGSLLSDLLSAAVAGLRPVIEQAAAGDREALLGVVEQTYIKGVAEIGKVGTELTKFRTISSAGTVREFVEPATEVHTTEVDPDEPN